MSPWMYSEEEDVTDFGFVAPEYQEMAAEARDEEVEILPPGVTENSGSAEGEPNAELMAQAMSTMQKQADIISKLMTMMVG